MSEARTTFSGVDPDAEREVDLRSAWERITARWWLPVGGLVVGAILGVIVSIGSGDVYKAEALIYLGQPFTPSGGGQIQSLQTNPKTVSEILRSEAATKTAAAAADMSPGALRGNVTSTPVVQAGQVARNFTPLVQIAVRAPTMLGRRAKLSRPTEVVPPTMLPERVLHQIVPITGTTRKSTKQANIGPRKAQPVSSRRRRARRASRRCSEGGSRSCRGRTAVSAMVTVC